MNDTGSSFRSDLPTLRSLIEDAVAILIGAGAGLSAAAGLLYTDVSTFRSWFPGYHERYGLTYIYEAAFFNFPTVEEYYAYWARHITAIRFNFPAGQPYLDLYAIMKERNYFVLTTNVDGQFAKAGFEPRRICTPQGDYGFFQCSKPCSDELYPNEQMILAMQGNMTDGAFAIRSIDIPTCRRCNSLLVPNIRKDTRFIEAPWMENYQNLDKFLEQAKGKILLLELGVGFNTPTIIRYPFERMSANQENTKLIRVNRDEPQSSIKVAGHAITAYSVDLALFIGELRKSFISPREAYAILHTIH
jgi:NAD-dependent SIR2 family protein deacetylase